MKARTFLIPGAVVLGVAVLVTWAASVQPSPSPPAGGDNPGDELAEVVRAIDQRLERGWREAEVEPAVAADDLHVLRRLSLVLHGTIPSLEEVRRFEADTRPDRRLHWTTAMLDDPRFGDYFAERLARACVGTDFGQFLVFRRDRFVDWLAARLAENRPWDETVQELIASEGLWTGEPATNFVTAAITEDDIDENKLAGRTVRAFLGQRIDCAQCHDHPFAEWKQDDFEGLAAFFGQTRLSLGGVEDMAAFRAEPVEYLVDDAEGPAGQRKVAARVPFDVERLAAEGTRRQRLAAWITHRENRRFHRATVNRMWGLLFGRAYTWPDHDVDNIPDPPPRGREASADVLDLLADDFRDHGCDLRRLILTITASRAFRLSSRHAARTDAELARAERVWSVFPVTRLRPEQLIGAMWQASAVGTVDRNSHLLVRIGRFFGERDFVQEYGDLGENELDEHSGTIAQALLRMNGNLAGDLPRAAFLNAAGRIAAVARDPETCVEAVYLVCLTRRPTAGELSAFAGQLHGIDDDQRRQAIEDLCWALFNLEEFAWNH